MDWDLYPNFSEDEFRCHGEDCCGGQAAMAPNFMEYLQRLRSSIHTPMIVTSGFRCAVHNARVGGGPAHPTGKAADIQASGTLAWKIMTHAWAFRGIGVKQHGPHDKRFIHLDTLEPGEFEHALRPAVWSYT